MSQSIKRGLVLILIALLIFGALYFTNHQTAEEPIQTAPPEASAVVTPEASEQPIASSEPEDALLDEDGSYTTKEDVALYLHQYGHLPSNFMTKKEAQALG